MSIAPFKVRKKKNFFGFFVNLVFIAYYFPEDLFLLLLLLFFFLPCILFFVKVGMKLYFKNTKCLLANIVFIEKS